MKKSLLLTLAFIAIIMLLISACSSSSPTDATTTVTLSDAEMQALVEEKCSQCHSVDRVWDNSYSESRWSTVFDSMIAKGAQVSEEEKAQMIDWLVANQ
ncbi:MAG: cytochrome c [Chloroflexota bacterium]|nr:cytochrome c [Chloroflexota bacterium]